MPFNALQLAAPLLTALQEEGYTKPTPIQAQAIPAILEGRDVLGCAQTGTGKTAAFALPILHKLLTMPADKTRRGPALPRALILAPTRELAEQIGESFATYGRHTGLVHTCIYGGVSQFHQVRALHRGVDILVATPGRLEDLMQQQIVTLKEVRVLVLDEADRMLDMGFIQPIRRIAAAVPSTPERPRHTLLFSATMPKEIMHLADSLLKNPVKVAVTPVASAAPLIAQTLYHVPKADKQTLLHHLLRGGDVRRAVVFTKTKFGADRVSRRLRKSGIPAGEIHGNKAQNQRTRALDAFRDGRTRVLVATDVAARGLDVEGITHVFNFDLPMEPESYVHRIGRTGRAGATGIAVSFCDPSERGLLRDIEKLTGRKIPVTPTPTDMEPVDGSPEPLEAFKRGASEHAPRKPLHRKGSNKTHAASHEPARPQPAPSQTSVARHREAYPDQVAPRTPAHVAQANPAPRVKATNATVPLTDPIKPKQPKTPHDHSASWAMVRSEEVDSARPTPRSAHPGGHHAPKHPKRGRPFEGQPEQRSRREDASRRGAHGHAGHSHPGARASGPAKPAPSGHHAGKPGHPVKGSSSAPRPGHSGSKPARAGWKPGPGKPAQAGRPMHGNTGGGPGRPRANTKRSRPWR